MDREKVIKGLQEIVVDNWMKTHADWYVSVCSDALALLKEQDAEIAFLKAMQLQTAHNMSNEDIGNAVRNVLRL